MLRYPSNSYLKVLLLQFFSTVLGFLACIVTRENSIFPLKILLMQRGILFNLLMFIGISASQAQLLYPVTEKIDHTDTYFGTIVEDPYQWLEDDNSAATGAWVDLQNLTTANYLDQIPYRAAIKARLTELANYPRAGGAFRAGSSIIYSRNDGLQNQAVWYIKEGLDGEEQVLLDPNELDDKGTTAITFSGTSKDNQYVAVRISKAGSDWSTMKIMDLRNRTFLEDELEWVKFSSATWLLNGFFYSRYPRPAEGKEFSAASEYQSIYYHSLGTPQESDLLIYTDSTQPRHYHSVSLTDDSRYLVMYKSAGTDGYETYYRDMQSDNLETMFTPLFRGFSHKNSVIGHHNGLLYVYTNLDAPNYRVIGINAADPNPNQWIDIIPEDESVLQLASFAGGNLVLSYLENVSSKIYITDADGENRREVELPGIGAATISHAQMDDSLIFYSFNSFTEPGALWYFNTISSESKKFFSAELTFNPDEFETRQVWYKSKDGTSVPMFITHKKGLTLDGSNPAYLYGYGGFNISEKPKFSSFNIALLEQGVVMVTANLRGGGEFGEAWHKAGMLMQKQNVFDDFISAAEYLIEAGYTSSEKLAIAGRSNGGLLVGACMTQRPDLFKVAFPGVGVLDMLKYQDFTVGWGWVPEYGSSTQSKEMFEYLYNYSPYHQLKEGVAYPATMITTGDHDDRVVPAHSFKFAARLQEYHGGDLPVLIRIDKQAGHGAGKPISKLLDEVADLWSFFLWNVGVKAYH